MRLSFQTACIIFGVTLAHVFVISALSPVEGETSVSRPRIELDPELASLLEADASHLVEDESTEAPIHPFPGRETGAAPAPPAEPIAQPAPNLAGNEGHPALSPSEAAALDPVPATREIRTITPVPRS